MFIIFWKNLFKCLPTTTPSSHPLISEQDHTQLLQSYSKPAADAASPASSTTKSIMIKNFNSLYDLSSASTSKSLSTPSTYSFSSSDSHSDSDSPPDFASIFASQRFFFSSPGLSNSIIESSGLEPEPQSPLGGGVVVKKYSPDPYTDFKDSMQEMIEARKLKDVRDDWDYLHELLFCYLSLNPKSTHKYIIRAFADLIICLLSSSSTSESDAVKNPQACRGLSNNISRWLV